MIVVLDLEHDSLAYLGIEAHSAELDVSPSVRLSIIASNVSETSVPTLDDPCRH
jgi:hypothetical protein